MVESASKHLSKYKMIIRKLKTEELEIVNELAHKIWPDTFKDILTQDQIEYMLNWMYDPEMLRKQLSEGHQFMIVEDEGVPIAFMGIQPGFPTEKSLKIHKLYVLPEIQGKGIGKLLVEEAKSEAKKAQLDQVVLNVNRYNRAVDFYKRIGFSILKEENIDIGKGYLMEDFVMGIEMCKH